MYIMVKETKEQRELRRAEEKSAQLAAEKVFRESLPARMMAMQEMATKLGIETHVTLDSIGPRLSFNGQGFYADEPVHYQSDEWQVEHYEERLKELQAARDAYMERRTMAQNTWSLLSAEQQLAIKEHLSFLR